MTQFTGGNIILGGDGSDIIEGRGGNDLIDGDRWLNVRLRVVDGDGNQIATANSMAGIQAAVFAGTYNPGQIRIVREILTPTNVASDVDTAVFSGNAADYIVVISDPLAQGRTTVTDTVGTGGTDTLINIERLQFADQLAVIDQTLPNAPATGNPAISDPTPTEGQLLTANAGNLADVNGFNAGTIQFRWEAMDPGENEWMAIAGSTGASFTPGEEHVGLELRVVASFTDFAGGLETVFSLPTDYRRELQQRAHRCARDQRHLTDRGPAADGLGRVDRGSGRH